jgi:hypothetical protein
MGLSDLFRKSEWKELKAFPTAVQQEIAYLLAFDSLVKAVVANGVRRLRAQNPVGSSGIRARFCESLSEDNLIHEIQLAALSTGVGKELSAVHWSFLPPFRPVSILGILAMCEYRNAEQLSIENDLKHSGYSAYPDEARTQLLVLVANKEGIDDLDQVRAFDIEVFRDFWIDLRRTIFIDLQLNVASEPPGLSLTTKERFEKLSAPRKEILLLFAESLSKKKPNSEPKQVQPKSAPAPFNLAHNQKEHPFKYVPYPKLIHVMRDLSPRIEQFFRQLSIDDYELRRLIGAKRDATNELLTELIRLDADTAGYCIVVAAVTTRERDFSGCGVWKKLTEAVESKNMVRFGVAAQAMATGIIGDAQSDLDASDSKRTSLALNLVQEIRRSPQNYLKASGDDVSRLSSLLAGTMVLKHVLNHPRFGTTLSKYLIESINSLDPILEEIKSGELLTWDQQEKLDIMA